MATFSFINWIVAAETKYSSGETIQGRKLFEEIRYVSNVVCKGSSLYTQYGYMYKDHPYKDHPYKDQY